MSRPISPIYSAQTDALDNSGEPQWLPVDRPNRSYTPLRFLQASDFRLDAPCTGVPGLSEDVRDCFAEARYLAAQRVFDAAVSREVDFVVLAGGLLDARLPGLRSPWFLAEQFRRLAEQGIEIYWAGASLETRGRWPAHVEVPANVHRLPADATGILHNRSGHLIARLLTFPPSTTHMSAVDGVFTIAVQPRYRSVPEDLGAGIDYWALGGLPEHETVQVGEVVAHFAGSPQGRSLEEIGQHSCSLVEVDGTGAVRIQPIATDVVRWHHRHLSVEGNCSWSELQERLDHLQDQLQRESPAVINLVSWTVQGEGLAVERLLQPRLHSELISRLNRSSADGHAATWTTAIDVLVEPQQRSQWQSQKTPLGAFLRELDELSPHVPELFGTACDGPHPLGATTDRADPQIVQRVVNEGVRWLGTEDQFLRPAA